jgi:hypothetical protein
MTWRTHLAGAVAAALGAVACSPAASPARGAEAACVDACASRVPRCGKAACTRGCNLVIDRLVEGEGTRVVACVAQASGACDDRQWSRCAARVGPHVDGGPPAPLPPSDDDVE